MHRSTALRSLYDAASKVGGRPPAPPHRSRGPTRSDGWGMTARIPRRRKWLRIARDESARPARSASRNTDGGHDHLEGRGVARLTGGDAKGQGPRMVVAGEMDLRALAAARASQRVVSGSACPGAPFPGSGGVLVGPADRGVD